MGATGLVMAVASGFLASCTSMNAKLLKDDLTPLEMTLCKSIINTMVIYSYLVVNGRGNVLKGVDGNTMASLLLRGIMFVISIAMVATVHQNMPLGDASALIGSNTIMTGFLGIFILKEKWHLPEILISLFCWAGVVLIARPPFMMGNSEGAVVDDGGHRFFYSMLALCSVVTSSLTMLFARKIGNRLDASRLVLISEMVSAVCCIGIVQTTLGGVHLPPQNAWTYLPVLSLTGIMGQVLLAKSLQTEKAASAAIFSTASYVTTSFIFQMVIFQNTPELTSILGAGLIMSSTVFLSWRKLRQKRKQS
ncbi:solute carrier family 35 member G1-like [Glandiceps talaboti]